MHHHCNKNGLESRFSAFFTRLEVTSTGHQITPVFGYNIVVKAGVFVSLIKPKPGGLGNNLHNTKDSLHKLFPLGIAGEKQHISPFWTNQKGADFCRFSRCRKRPHTFFCGSSLQTSPQPETSLWTLGEIGAKPQSLVPTRFLEVLE